MKRKLHPFLSYICVIVCSFYVWLTHRLGSFHAMFCGSYVTAPHVVMRWMLVFRWFTGRSYQSWCLPWRGACVIVLAVVVHLSLHLSWDDAPGVALAMVRCTCHCTYCDKVHLSLHLLWWGTPAIVLSTIKYTNHWTCQNEMHWLTAILAMIRCILNMYRGCAPALIMTQCTCLCTCHDKMRSKLCSPWCDEHHTFHEEKHL